MLEVNKIPTHIGYYLAGFTDGEGSFNVSFRPRDDFRIPWKVSLCFNVSQKDKVILALFKQHLKCGTMRQRNDGIWYYEINNLIAINQNLIPFFKKFHFLSAKKKRDFCKFQQIAEIINQQKHLTEQGIQEILKIRRDMNDGGKRKFSENEIIQKLPTKKSSETTRQAPDNNQGDDIVHTV